MHCWPQCGKILSYIIVETKKLDANLASFFKTKTAHVLNSSRPVFPYKCKDMYALLFKIKKNSKNTHQQGYGKTEYPQ